MSGSGDTRFEKAVLTIFSIIMDIEDRLKLMRKKHRAPSNLGLFRYDGNCVGGSMIGIGMAMTGAWYVNRSVRVHLRILAALKYLTE